MLIGGETEILTQQKVYADTDDVVVAQENVLKKKKLSQEVAAKATRKPRPVSVLMVMGNRIAAQDELHDPDARMSMMMILNQ